MFGNFNTYLSQYEGILMDNEGDLINQVKVIYEDDDSRKVKCFCGEVTKRSFVTHMKRSIQKHGKSGVLIL